MIYGIVIFVVTLIVDLWTDYRLWLKYRNQFKPDGAVNHKVGAIIRLIALGVVIWFLGLASIPVVLFTYWIIFDGVFNILTGQDWLRIGTTASLDKLQLKYPILVWVKYFGFAASVILFILVKQPF